MNSLPKPSLIVGAASLAVLASVPFLTLPYQFYDWWPALVFTSLAALGWSLLRLPRLSRRAVVRVAAAGVLASGVSAITVGVANVLVSTVAIALVYVAIAAAADLSEHWRSAPTLLRMIPVLVLAGIGGFLASLPFALGAFPLLILLIGALLTVYFVPSIVARRQNSPNLTPIFLINLFAGFTLIGWVGALAWAVMPERPSSAAPPTPASTDAAQAMRELAELRDAGLVSPEEYEVKRGELLQRI